ncbi:TetR family transcriptional regulator [Mycolicibacterium sp. TY66]|uniref:TetR/AcrR family transcriptional regulator n=1 Tax=Mycobacteriaceae TaxID=1762 RepID=UPI001BB413DD|nr:MULTISPECIES: TetR/AcrR family transcriptional regulator [unclassified Mycolicibacterium]BCI84373.1 TetR family transcriptional regulator [Mycolicibacterium sp. TY66]BCJ84005.1 TetR family transcriptional regulator [Mycolicibacterium sp. TY81]
MDLPDSPRALTFARARSPEQREDRLRRLTEATRALLDSTRAGELTLGDVAAAAGLAKSGVLRYAGSREALLLLVMYHEHLGWLDDLRAQLRDERRSPAKALAHTLARRPVLCDLISAAPVLMNRLTPEAAETVRTQARDVEDRLRETLRPRLPLDRQHLVLLTAAIHAFVGAVWGWAAIDSVNQPEPGTEFEETLAALLRTFVAGLKHQ